MISEEYGPQIEHDLCHDLPFDASRGNSCNVIREKNTVFEFGQEPAFILIYHHGLLAILEDFT
jgi:hypothetical protein